MQVRRGLPEEGMSEDQGGCGSDRGWMLPLKEHGGGDRVRQVHRAA